MKQERSPSEKESKRLELEKLADLVLDFYLNEQRKKCLSNSRQKEYTNNELTNPESNLDSRLGHTFQV